jgi:hypothetical protein
MSDWTDSLSILAFVILAITLARLAVVPREESQG